MKNLFILVCLTLLTFSCADKKQDIAYQISLDKVSRKAVFIDNPTYTVWGASMVKSKDGLYHIYYSRWPKSLGWAWVTDSEIAHAIGKTPFGPFTFHDVALPRRGKDYWDGLCTHNPTIHLFGDTYYLYYMGNTGDGKNPCKPGKADLNWIHRNNQRIGVAVADNPNGPWKRFDKPVLNRSSDSLAIDAIMTSNPSVCEMTDGKILMVYKGVGAHFPAPNYGPVDHCVAIGDTPIGPFKKYPKPVFTVKGERFPAEDPYIWYGDGKYRAIVKRIKNEGNKTHFSLGQYESNNGIDWKESKNYLVSEVELTWADGAYQKLAHLERPQVFLENGQPKVLLCAADTLDNNHIRCSFNVQIPLTIKKDFITKKK